MLCGLHTGHAGDITISAFVFIAASYQVHGTSRIKEMLFQTGMFWVRRNFLLIGAKSVYCFRSIRCQFERYAADRKLPPFALGPKKQQQMETPFAQ